jgi:hypothetical protein
MSNRNAQSVRGMNPSSRRLAACAFIAAAALAGCSGGAEPAEKAGPAPAAQDVAVDIRPREAALETNESVVFAAAVTGTANHAVAWQVVEAGGGTVDENGRYTAPGRAGTYRVRVSSVVDGTKSATATVTVTPAPVVGVSIAPASPTVDECRTLTFTATVTNATNRAVRWSVQEPDGGTVTAAGVYTAPAQPGTFHVVATSEADGTRSAVVPVTVRTNVLGVAVAPAAVTLPASGTAQLTATVTTTCGAFTTALQ